MSSIENIAADIPYLRRFARALAGSREGGDAYALATVEAVVADAKKITAAADGKVALFRVFLDIWTAAPINSHTDSASSSLEEEGARRNLDAISLRPRIAFLLHAVEGFDGARIAETLGVSQDEAAALIALANEEIADQIATDVLIIEDEPLIALDLSAVVEELGHRVVGVARTHREAMDYVGGARPGLILADIQLADGSSGLDAVNDLLAAFATPVIFVTAYPERFLTGAPPEPAFLVAKPFSVDSLKAVISQALFFDKKSHRREKAAPNA